MAVWPVELARLPQWLRARATSLELDIDDDAVRFIVERTEGNLLAAQQELEKLRLGAAGSGNKTRIDLAAGAGLDRRQRALRRVPARRGRARRRRAARAAHPRGAAQRRRGADARALVHHARNPRRLGHARSRAPSRGWQKPSAALENAKRRAAKLPYARLAARASRADRMIKGQQRGDAWDEMALIIVEFAGRRALPITGTRAA